MTDMADDPSREDVSAKLAPNHILSLLRALQAVFKALVGDAKLIARYGFGNRLHGDLWGKPMRVATAWLDRFVQQTIEQQIFAPGDSDLCIALENGDLRIFFCNEALLHVGGNSAQLRRAFLASEPFNAVEMVGWIEAHSS